MYRLQSENRTDLADEDICRNIVCTCGCINPGVVNSITKVDFELWEIIRELFPRSTEAPSRLPFCTKCDVLSASTNFSRYRLQHCVDVYIF